MSGHDTRHLICGSARSRSTEGGRAAGSKTLLESSSNNSRYPILRPEDRLSQLTCPGRFKIGQSRARNRRSRLLVGDWRRRSNRAFWLCNNRAPGSRFSPQLCDSMSGSFRRLFLDFPERSRHEKKRVNVRGVLRTAAVQRCYSGLHLASEIAKP